MTLSDRLRASLGAPPPSGLLAGDIAEGGPERLREAAVLIAIGIDPERATLFVQSHVEEHAAFSCDPQSGIHFA